MPGWGWICIGITVVGLLILFIQAHFAEKRERKQHAEHGISAIGWLVQANTALFSQGSMNMPAQVFVAFDGETEVPDESIRELARRAMKLKDTKPRDPVEAAVAKLVSDESYHPFKRFLLPPEFTGGRKIYSMHIMIERKKLPGKVLRHPFVRCSVLIDRPDTRLYMQEYRPDDRDFLI